MKKVLIIDDEPAIPMLLKQVFERADYIVHTALNAKDGFKLMQKQAIDLVVTDIVMPDIEGVEVILTIRNLYPHVKIIAMSGGGRSSSETYLDSAKLLGADIVLEKPFDNKQLIAEANVLLAGLK